MAVAWTITKLKDKAKAAGLWNMFLPDAELGAGLSVQEYAHIAELTGGSFWHPPYLTVMHLIAAIWKCYGAMVARNKNNNGCKPFACRRNRSVFWGDWTRRGVQSMRVTNMQATAVIDGDEIVPEWA